MCNFTKSVTELRPILMAMAMSYTNKKEDAEDLVQDVMIKAILNEHKWDPNRGKLLSWMGTMMRNMFLDASRSEMSRSVKLSGFCPQTVQDPAQDFDIVDIRSTMNIAINRLPKRMRYVMRRRLDGVRYRIIADELDCSLNNVKTIAHRAKGKLRELLK